MLLSGGGRKVYGCDISVASAACFLADGKYDLSIDDVLRHYDEGGKNCPKYYVEHEEAWTQLKQDIADYIAENGTYKAPADSAEESENTEAEE